MKNLILIILLIISSKFFAQDTITAGQSVDYMDKTMFVTGKVISFKVANEGKTTNYLNIDRPYPNAVFTVVLSNSYLAEKSLKIEDLQTKTICVLGKITTFKDDPKQIPQIYNPTKFAVLVK